VVEEEYDPISLAKEIYQWIGSRLCAVADLKHKTLNIERMMIVEQMLKNAPNPLLHIADVSGSALFQGDCLDIMPLIPDNSID
jgi:hypothetical protein